MHIAKLQSLKITWIIRVIPKCRDFRQKNFFANNAFSKATYPLTIENILDEKIPC